MIKFLFAFIFYILTACPVMAAGLAVTLYPDSADVREEQVLSVENNSFSILLPDSAVRESVRLNVKGAEVRSVAFTDVPRVDSPRTQAARNAVDTAQAALAALDAQLAVLAARISLWQNPPVRLDGDTALRSTDAAVAAHLPALLDERGRIVTQRATAAQDVLRLQNELRRVSGEIASQNLTSVQLTATLAPRPADTPSATTLPVVLNYSLGNCGWTPEYRLEAFTDRQQVRVSRLAAIRQNSGTDWADAVLRLSTARPAAHVNPQPVREWRILSGGPEPRNVDAAPMMALGTAPRAFKSASGEGAAAPVHDEGAAAMTWDLGTRAVNSGDALLLTLDSQDWKADFYRLLRPGQQSASWLMAAVTPPVPQIFPEAQARLVVDGVTMGEAPFAFSGAKGDVALGIDPAVTADMVLDSNQSGDKGILSKSQTRVWSWRISVRSAHAAPVLVHVEDAAPQSGDQRIVVRVDSTPSATVEDNVLRWSFTLPGNGKTDIAHAVSFSAPADMRVRAGR